MRAWILAFLAACGQKSSPPPPPLAGSAKPIDAVVASGDAAIDALAIAIDAPNKVVKLVPEGLIDCTPERWCRFPNTTPGDPIMSVDRVTATDIWAIGSFGFVVHRDGARMQHWFLETQTDDISADGDDAWVSTSENFVFRFHDGAWTKIDIGVHTIDVSKGWFVAYSMKNELVHVTPDNKVERVTVPFAPSAVWAAAPDDIWVLGKDRAGRWNGTKWSEMKLPIDPSSSGFYPDLDGLGTDDVWALVTYPFHWDGKTWSRVANAPDGDHVSILAHDDVIISRNEYKQWNGSAWNVVSERDLVPRDERYGAIDFWVGPDAIYETIQTADDRGEVARWDGERWTRERLDGKFPREIDGIETPWIVGYDGDVWHRDGATWLRENPKLDRPEWIRVVAPDDIWIAGEKGYAHRANGAWVTGAMKLRALGTGKGQVFVVDGTGALLRWDGKAFAKVVDGVQEYPQLVVRGETSVEIFTIRGGHQIWNGDKLTGSSTDQISDVAVVGDVVFTLDWKQGNGVTGAGKREAIPGGIDRLATRDGVMWAMARGGQLVVRSQPR